jgi:hypothetical protein
VFQEGIGDIEAVFLLDLALRKLVEEPHALVRQQRETERAHYDNGPKSHGKLQTTV